MDLRKNMNILNDMKIGAKLFVGFGGGIVAITVIVLLNFFQTQNLGDIHHKGADLAASVGKVAATGKEVAGLRNVIVNTELHLNFAASRQAWDAAKKATEAALAGMDASANDDPELALAGKAREEYNQIVSLFEKKMLPALEAEKRITPEILALDTEMGTHGDAFQSAMDEFINRLNQESILSDKSFDTAQTNTNNFEWLIAIVTLVIMLAQAIVISTNLTSPIIKSAAMMKELSLGHLGNRLNIERRDEIGDLTRTMDAFADDLQNTVVDALKNIADGDLSMEIVKKDELDEISPALTQIITALRDLVAETVMLTRAGTGGRLSTIRSDASRFKGGYHEIVMGMNNTLDTVIGPLNMAASYVDKIAGGVVPPPISDNYNGDFNILKNNLNRMSERLRAMLIGISDVTNNLNSAAAEILAATTQQASGASEQSAAISQTALTVGEVKTSSEQVSLRVQDVVGASQRTVEVARAGQASVQTAIENMGMIKDRVEDISANLLALSSQTQQIGEIIATVNEIASQSNMLALNASVEAARAGEHGKGFAVVATEVRSLAGQSRQATQQIKSILSEIQKATNSTVAATEEGVKGVDRGVQLSAQSRESIEQLAAVINESAQIAAQVVADGQQQQAGIDDVALAMQSIDQATTQNMVSALKAEKSAQNLNDAARKMSEILAQYRF